MWRQHRQIPDAIPKRRYPCKWLCGGADESGTKPHALSRSLPTSRFRTRMHITLHPSILSRTLRIRTVLLYSAPVQHCLLPVRELPTSTTGHSFHPRIPSRAHRKSSLYVCLFARLYLPLLLSHPVPECCLPFSSLLQPPSPLPALKLANASFCRNG